MTSLTKKDVVQFTKSSTEKKWIPKETYHTVETFIETFNKELKIEEKVKKATPNERDALLELSERDDIIITKADKGGATVVINVDDYIQEANRQLNNTY